MKTSYQLFMAFIGLSLLSCSNDDASNNCPGAGVISNDYITYQYFNSGAPNLSSNPILENGNIVYDQAFAQAVDNGVDIVIPGVRIRSESNNFEITRIKIEEKAAGDDCFVLQNEFDNAQTSFQTDIATVLVFF